MCNPRKNALLKEGSKSDRIDARKLAELLYMSNISSVYHGEHGLRMLKELSRSYLTITKDLTRVMNRLKALYRGGPFPVPERKSTHRVTVRNGSPRSAKQACAGGRNFTTNNSTPYGWCANKPGEIAAGRRESTMRRSCYARFLVLVRFGLLTWWP